MGPDGPERWEGGCRQVEVREVREDPLQTMGSDHVVAAIPISLFGDGACPELPMTELPSPTTELP